jgi:signal transduction histidine kinase/CheY-like chemotaxis protein
VSTEAPGGAAAPGAERAQPGARGPEQVVVLAPSGRDAKLTVDLLGRDGVAAAVCADVDGLCLRVEAGRVSAALIAEEALGPRALARIGEALRVQPPWSDLPVVVFGAASRDGGKSVEDERLLALGNVTFLDRPVQVRTMLAAVRASLRARRRQHEARRAIEARDQFLAMLGHELRNPLGAIRMACELFAMTTTEAQRQRNLAIIDRQSRHLGRLVDDLLDVSRVTAGKIVLQSERLDLVELVRGCFQAIEPTARAQQIDCALDAPPGPLPVRGDRVRLDQVFNNLLTNAVKYTPRGGAVRVGLRREGGAALVTFADSGVGIAPEMLERVFELFAQADHSLARSQGGMGLGLTLARNLARLHGGDIEASSEGAGRGSTFTVRLPAEPPEPPAAAAGRAPAARDGSATAKGAEGARRIVVVDDNEDIRESFAMILGLLGHDVVTADDGPAGVARIVGERPEIAFVDLGLPGFDGYELARRVRAACGGAPRLVAVSGYGQPEDQRRSAEAGFDAHLTKPVGDRELRAVMASMFG